jgi:hypothetical protein
MRAPIPDIGFLIPDCKVGIQDPASSILNLPKSSNRQSAIEQYEVVLFAQLAVSFVLWILFGWMQARRAARWRTVLNPLSRPLRTALGPILMLCGAAVLLAAVWLMAGIHGLVNGSLTMPGWFIVTVLGLVFIGAQMISALMMVSLAAENEPAGIPQASDGRIKDRNSHESKTSAHP